jgi:hypothetical protein
MGGIASRVQGQFVKRLNPNAPATMKYTCQRNNSWCVAFDCEKVFFQLGLKASDLFQLPSLLWRCPPNPSQLQCELGQPPTS